MATTLAQYFTNELQDWNRTIAFYSAEIDGLTTKLNEVVRRNSIPHIATLAEAQQDKLNAVLNNFYRLQLQFRQQESKLRTDSTLVDDSFVKEDIEDRQKGLRTKMAQAEKECVDIRADCQNFLLKMFKKRTD